MTPEYILYHQPCLASGGEIDLQMVACSSAGGALLQWQNVTDFQVFLNDLIRQLNKPLGLH